MTRIAIQNMADLAALRGESLERVMARAAQKDADIASLVASSGSPRVFEDINRASGDFAAGLDTPAARAWMLRFFDPTRMSKVKEGDLPNAYFLMMADPAARKKAAELAQGSNARARQKLGLTGEVTPFQQYSPITAEDVQTSAGDFYRALLQAQSRGRYPDFDERILPQELLHMRALALGFPHRGYSRFGDQTVQAGFPGTNAAQGTLDITDFVRGLAEARLRAGQNRTLPRALEDVGDIQVVSHMPAVKRQLAQVRGVVRAGSKGGSR